MNLLKTLRRTNKMGDKFKKSEKLDEKTPEETEILGDKQTEKNTDKENSEKSSEKIDENKIDNNLDGNAEKKESQSEEEIIANLKNQKHRLKKDRRKKRSMFILVIAQFIIFTVITSYIDNFWIIFGIAIVIGIIFARIGKIMMGEKQSKMSKDAKAQAKISIKFNARKLIEKWAHIPVPLQKYVIKKLYHKKEAKKIEERTEVKKFKVIMGDFLKSRKLKREVKREDYTKFFEKTAEEAKKNKFNSLVSEIYQVL
jgi:hypothetical protein